MSLPTPDNKQDLQIYQPLTMWILMWFALLLAIEPLFSTLLCSIDTSFRFLVPLIVILMAFCIFIH